MSRQPKEEISKTSGAELDEARRNLEQLSFSVSHDLRAPLRAIEGYSSILLEEHANNLDADGQRLLNSIVANAQKLSDQITAILEYSRAGRNGMHPVAIDMHALVQEVWDEVKPPGRTVQFELADLPPTWGDRAALRVVVGKLLDNAVKFTGKCDKPEIRISARSEPPGPCYEVADNGAGYDPAYADKLFGLFQRLHTVDTFPGLGSGLAVARLLLERQGGWIRGEAVPDGGARFCFGLPQSPLDS